MKNKLWVTLAGLLLATGLSAVELPYSNEHLGSTEIEEKAKETLEDYLIANHKVGRSWIDSLRYDGDVSYDSTKLNEFLFGGEIKEGNFVCAKEVIWLLYSLDKKSAGYTETRFWDETREKKRTTCASSQ